MVVAWSAFQIAAPEMAERIQMRFEDHVHHVLGTIRPSGAPRLSGTEIHVLDGELTLGMMDDSLKQRDVHRDPRIEVHSNPDDHELAAGDARIAGLVEATGPAPMPEGADDTAATGTMYRILIARAVLVRVQGDRLELRSWTPRVGETVEYRS